MSNHTANGRKAGRPFRVDDETKEKLGIKVTGNCNVAKYPQNNMTMEILGIKKEKSKGQEIYLYAEIL